MWKTKDEGKFNDNEARIERRWRWQKKKNERSLFISPQSVALNSNGSAHKIVASVSFSF